MTQRVERRRRRTCPSCGGDNIVRGSQVDGIGVPLAPATEMSAPVYVPAYSDVCSDCGFVMLYVRIGDFEQSPT
jgi:hypothetical protein